MRKQIKSITSLLTSRLSSYVVTTITVHITQQLYFLHMWYFALTAMLLQHPSTLLCEALLQLSTDNFFFGRYQGSFLPVGSLFTPYLGFFAFTQDCAQWQVFQDNQDCVQWQMFHDRWKSSRAYLQWWKINPKPESSQNPHKLYSLFPISYLVIDWDWPAFLTRDNVEPVVTNLGEPFENWSICVDQITFISTRVLHRRSLYIPLCKGQAVSSPLDYFYWPSSVLSDWKTSPWSSVMFLSSCFWIVVWVFFPYKEPSFVLNLSIQWKSQIAKLYHRSRMFYPTVVSTFLLHPFIFFTPHLWRFSQDPLREEKFIHPQLPTCPLAMSCPESQKTGKNADSSPKQVIFKKSTRDKAVSTIIMGINWYEFHS